MKRLFLIAAALAALSGTAQADPLPGRDMTCRGLLYGTKDLRAVGTCYIQANPTASESVNAACETEQPCIIRARVVRRDTPNGMPQSYTVLKVYSARRPRP